MPQILTSLAESYQKYGKLTEKQIALVRKLLKKYIKQLLNIANETERQREMMKNSKITSIVSKEIILADIRTSLLKKGGELAGYMIIKKLLPEIPKEFIISVLKVITKSATDEDWEIIDRHISLGHPASQWVEKIIDKLPTPSQIKRMIMQRSQRY